MNSQLVYVRMSWFLPYSWGTILSDIIFPVDFFPLSLSTWKCSFPLPSELQVLSWDIYWLSYRRSTVKRWVAYLCYFQDPLSLTSSSLIIMYLAVGLCRFHCRWKLVSNIWISISFIKFGKFFTIISSNNSSNPFSLFPLCYVLDAYIDWHRYYSVNPLGPVHSSLFFLLHRLDNFKSPVFKLADYFFCLLTCVSFSTQLL